MKIPTKYKATCGLIVCGLAIVGGDRLVNGDPESEKAAAAAEVALNTAVVQEMDARFTNPADPLDKSRFTFDSVNSKLFIKNADSRWREAASRVDAALEESLESAGAGRGQDNHRDAAFACGLWVLNNGVPDAASFQLPTIEAYNGGAPEVATRRCLGSITARVAQGELTQIQYFAGMAT